MNMCEVRTNIVYEIAGKFITNKKEIFHTSFEQYKKKKILPHESDNICISNNIRYEILSSGNKFHHRKE